MLAMDAMDVYRFSHCFSAFFIDKVLGLPMTVQCTWIVHYDRTTFTITNYMCVCNPVKNIAREQSVVESFASLKPERFYKFSKKLRRRKSLKLAAWETWVN